MGRAFLLALLLGQGATGEAGHDQQSLDGAGLLIPVGLMILVCHSVLAAGALPHRDVPQLPKEE